jgi:hypothetical protein
MARSWIIVVLSYSILWNIFIVIPQIGEYDANGLVCFGLEVVIGLLIVAGLLWSKFKTLGPIRWILYL